MEYTQVYDGKWIYPKRKYWKMKCCDCGLIHKMEFRLTKFRNGKAIGLRAWRMKKPI